jgi:hypothetical protein
MNLYLPVQEVKSNRDYLPEQVYRFKCKTMPGPSSELGKGPNPASGVSRMRNPIACRLAPQKRKAEMNVLPIKKQTWITTC